MKYLKIFIILLILYSANSIYYIFSLQFTCTEKINNNEELNKYEIVSALQTHLNMCIIGFAVDSNTAKCCIQKQFFIRNPIWGVKIIEDSKVKDAKDKLKINPKKEIRLAWSSYDSPASIYLNGSTLSIFWDEGIQYYKYTVPLDYKPGIVTIKGIKVSETVFDYLENKGLLGIYTNIHYEQV